MPNGIPSFRPKKNSLTRYWWGVIFNPTSLVRRWPLAGGIFVVSFGITLWVSGVTLWESRSQEKARCEQTAHRAESSLRATLALHQQGVEAVRAFADQKPLPSDTTVKRFVQSLGFDRDPVGRRRESPFFPVGKEPRKWKPYGPTSLRRLKKTGSRHGVLSRRRIVH
jgi:hypothetical protein